MKVIAICSYIATIFILITVDFFINGTISKNPNLTIFIYVIAIIFSVVFWFYFFRIYNNDKNKIDSEKVVNNEETTNTNQPKKEVKMFSKLTKCNTCKKEIAKSAKVCPHCGAKQESSSIMSIITSVIVIVVLVGIFSPDDSESNKTSDTSAKKEQLSDDQQQKIKHDKFVASVTPKEKKELADTAISYINSGIIYKVNRLDEFTDVLVTDKFKNLPYDQKNIVMTNLMSLYYYLNYKSTMLVIKDYKTNKVLGNFSLQWGLDLD